MTANRRRIARLKLRAGIGIISAVVLVLGLNVFSPALPPAESALGHIEFDLSCYIVGEHPTVTVTGSSFVAGSSLNVQLLKWVSGNKTVVASFPVTADASGGFTLSFSNPGEERIVAVTEISEPDVSLVEKTLQVTKFEAGYYDGVKRKGPTHVKDTMVMFGSGFAGGQQGTRGSGVTESLYLHRVPPKGSVKTEKLSFLQPCGFGGTNRVTGRALFKGSARVKSGKWKFQFDTSAKYKKSTQQKIVLRLKVTSGGVVKPGEQTQAGAQ